MTILCVIPAKAGIQITSLLGLCREQNNAAALCFSAP